MKYFWLCFYFLSIPLSVNAWCNIGEEHTTMSHYNAAQKVFVGKLIKKGNLEDDNFVFSDPILKTKGILLELKVQYSFRGDILSENITLALDALSMYEFQLGGTYIVYGYYRENYPYLVCSGGVDILDEYSMKRHLILDKIKGSRNGKFKEFSKYGNVWAEGELKNGVPSGKWIYYSLSGEKAEEGQYDEQGLRTKNWTSFYYTPNKVFQKFYTIAKRQNRAYELIDFKKHTSKDSLFRYEISYRRYSETGQGKIVTQYFFYNQSKKKYTQFFEKGKQEGPKITFSKEGEIMGSTHFKNNQPVGKYWDATYMEVLPYGKVKATKKGKFKNGRVKKEKTILSQGKKKISVEITFRNYKSVLE